MSRAVAARTSAGASATTPCSLSSSVSRLTAALRAAVASSSGGCGGRKEGGAGCRRRALRRAAGCGPAQARACRCEPARGGGGRAAQAAVRRRRGASSSAQPAHLLLLDAPHQRLQRLDAAGGGRQLGAHVHQARLHQRPLLRQPGQAVPGLWIGALVRACQLLRSVGGGLGGLLQWARAGTRAWFFAVQMSDSVGSAQHSTALRLGRLHHTRPAAAAARQRRPGTPAAAPAARRRRRRARPAAPPPSAPGQPEGQSSPQA